MQDEKLTFNYIVFAVLALGIIFGYSKMFPQKRSAKPAAQTEQTTAGKTPVAKKTDAGKMLPDLKFWAAEKENAPNANTVRIQTPLYTATVDTDRGAITGWKLKKYLNKAGEGAVPLALTAERGEAPEAVLSFGEKTFTSGIPFRYRGEKSIEVKGLAKEIALVYEKNGLKIVKTLSFSPNTYLVEGRYEIRNESGKTVEYAAHFLQNGKIEQSKYGSSDALVVSIDGQKKQFNGPGNVESRLSGRVDWLGFSKNYFILASLPESGRQTDVYAAVKSGNTIKTRFSYGRFSLLPGAVSVRKWKTYIGPKREDMLKAAGYGFENSIDYGWFGSLSKLAVKVLEYTNRFFNNYGLSIIVITFVFRLLFLPLSIRGMRSMKQMQKKMEAIKPKLDSLKEKFKDDRKRQNEEMMKLYSSHGINPLSSLGGCLPMLAQVPVFIALYYGLLYSIELRHSSFLWINDLSAPENLFNIPGTPVPFRILPLAMGVSWWLSTKLTPMTATGDTAAMQAKIMQFMPVVFTFVMWDFPSGLVLYWTVSNVLSVAQQMYINRSPA